MPTARGVQSSSKRTGTPDDLPPAIARLRPVLLRRSPARTRPSSPRPPRPRSVIVGRVSPNFRAGGWRGRVGFAHASLLYMRQAPTQAPTEAPSRQPTTSPSRGPTDAPSTSPTTFPTFAPPPPEVPVYPLQQGGWRQGTCISVPFLLGHSPQLASLVRRVTCVACQVWSVGLKSPSSAGSSSRAPCSTTARARLRTACSLRATHHRPATRCAIYLLGTCTSCLPPAHLASFAYLLTGLRRAPRALPGRVRAEPLLRERAAGLHLLQELPGRALRAQVSG